MKHDEIIIQAKRLVERINLKYPDFLGKTAKESDLAKLEKELKIKLSEWYIELYTTAPLIEAEFGIQEDEPDEEYDGVSYIEWGGVDDIIKESTKYEPGISVIKDGFVFLASCSHGSGDPIYVKLSSKQPKVFRIYNDDYSKNQLAEDLVSLFKNAII
ncbi:hypothetical protein D1B31_01360 [Neobacillus notoginsengisoli]|uniref:Knr4/Smi1-like domain-containing protein n=1 Tax=Neobacillus notoginsengisoli TaxID=1578198 RepID=A0A417Z008_9BACI|nr:SMI1/KNR4 family protein [Neobacillus notoginsengisoli]RHW43344.1 hypothetical protein D1B31_01360 [Neobacillus notoginsengisoli]